MSKVNADKKLELIKAIRLQNQYNRQLFRSREGFIYSDEPVDRQRELFSLEAEEKPRIPDNGKVYGSFRIRFVIAVFLLFMYILCDMNHISYKGENTDTLFGRMTSNFSVTELLERVK